MVTKQLKGIYMRKENGFGCVRILDEDGVAVEYGLVDAVSGSLEGVFDRDVVNCVMRLSDAELALLAAYRGKGCPFLERPLRCRVTRVLARAQDYVCGSYSVSGGKGYLLPDSYVPHRVPVSTKATVLCREGDKIYAQICKYKALAAMKVLPLENLGPAESLRACVDATLRGTPFETPFSAEACAEAKEAQTRRVPPSGRMDLRGRTLFTISQDLSVRGDFAFSIEPLENGCRLGVHMADAAELVAEGSALEREAAARGRSLFRSNLVWPMLPRELTADACLLRAGEDRPAVSVFLEYDMGGQLVSVSFAESIVNVAANATYEEIDSLLVGMDGSAILPLREKYAVIGGAVRELYELASLLRRARYARGGIDFEPFSMDFESNDERGAVPVGPTPAYDARLLVRELLIAAGAAVGAHFAENGLPMLYTAFADPRKTLLDHLETLEGLLPGLPLREYSDILRRVTEAAANGPVESAVTYLLRRILPSVRYVRTPAPHHLHALEAFVTFADPVGRYADLLVQRAIKNSIRYGAAAANDSRFDEKLRAAARKCSEQEEKCALLESRLAALYQIDALHGREGTRIACRVVAPNPSGAQVILDNGTPARIVFETPDEQTLAPGASIEAVLKSALFSTLTVELKL